MNTCLLVVLSVIAAVSAVELPWTGPLADHTLGQLVEDTPEVAAAKRLHMQAFSQIRSLLPELPEKEQFPGDQREPVYVPQFPQHVTAHPQIPQAFPHDPLGENRAPWTGPFADHKLGEQVRETPEVAAARKFHEDVFSRVKAVLPDLPEDHQENNQGVHHHQAVHPVVVPKAAQPTHYVPNVEAAHARAIMERISYLKQLLAHSTTTSAPLAINWNAQPAETPEVAAARSAHARAIAAVLGH